jgi:hypothetical protein
MILQDYYTHPIIIIIIIIIIIEEKEQSATIIFRRILLYIANRFGFYQRPSSGHIINLHKDYLYAT